MRPESAFLTQRHVEWRDLDSQEHVNNAHYVAFAEDAAVEALAALGWSPAAFKTQGLLLANKRVQIQYQSSASWGERLDVITHLVELKLAGGVWHIQIEHASDREPVARCLIEWSLANRMSGGEQLLPESLFHVLKEKVAIPENISTGSGVPG